VPLPLATPTSFASLIDVDLRRLISCARIRPLLATVSLPPPPATSVTEPVVCVPGNLGDDFGRVSRNQFRRYEERLPELIRRHMAWLLKADISMLG
jgi:hypothetical protein